MAYLKIGDWEMRVNGRLLDVPEVQNGIGYAVTPKGRRTLSPSQRPTWKSIMKPMTLPAVTGSPL